MWNDQTSAELTATLAATIEPLAREVVASFALAGLAIGVVKRGEFVYSQGFGVRSLETGEPVTPRTLFHLASVSKPFVATAVVQLVERGEIALEAPVVTYLPYFTLADPRHREITVQQLLSHASGMPDADDYRWYAPEEDDGALERYVRGLTGEKLLTAPGEEYAYSNAGFEVLGDLIAKVSGQPFEDYVKRHILDPLAMRDSTFLRREVSPDLAATPHFAAPLRVLPGAYPYNRAHGPSSTLHSSVEEMSHWLIANLSRGSFHGQRILAPASYDLLWHPSLETGEEGWGEAAGLGWFLGTYRGHRVLHHNGGDPGFESNIVLLPDAAAALVVLANANTAPLGRLADAVLDALLGERPEVPKPPITVPVAAALAADGPEAATETYRRLLAAAPERYDARPDRFLDAVWGAIEVHRAEVVMPLLRLWLTLQPDSADAHETLGWAYLVQGEQERAVDHLRQALARNPESELAPKFLEQLGVAVPAE